MNVVEKLTNDHKDLYKVYADVIRSNGAAETVDLSAKFFGMNAYMASCIRQANAKVGTKVVRIYRKVIKTNIAELECRYNDLMNEGGEGYIPDMTNSQNFRAEVVVEEF